ncbi:MAG TPA: secondary thiamine-phosphate synthase enzyme YjbQ [Flavitalea sp.]|nr:secondary thiamine-phosphate synthase enzyme YjbQ [Flavitalea sp.]
MNIYQKTITLAQKKRGFHLITSEILHAIDADMTIKTGICHIFIKHTSASLTINENADPTVRKDFETYFNKAVKENDPDYVHDTEGADDMPAHIKSSILGSSVTIPVTNGKLSLGMWQGIYLCEHRNHGDARDVVITIWGDDLYV